MSKKGSFGVVTHGDVAAMFSNLEVLLELHQEMLKQFEELNEKWPIINTIGKVFITKVSSVPGHSTEEQAPSLEPYGEYVKNFKHAVDTLLRCQEQDEKFANFLNEVPLTLALFHFFRPSTEPAKMDWICMLC